MTPSLVTEFLDSTLHLAYHGPFVLMNWRTDFDPAHIPKIEALHHRRAQHFGAGVIGLNIIEPACGLPSPASRRLGNEMMKRTAPTTRAVVMVMLDQGFAASALQSIALRVLGLGGRVPIRSFRAIGPAAEWIHFQYPEISERARIVQLIDDLRAG